MIKEEIYTDKELLDRAILMLAEWCNAVDKRGTSYDDWDYYYKTAMYNQHPLRQLIDDNIKRINNK